MAGKQVIGFDSQYFGEDEKLQVGNAPLLVLQGSNRIAAHVPTGQL